MSSADTSYPNGYKVTALGGIVGLNLLTLQAALGNIQDAAGVAAVAEPNVQILGGVLTDDPVNKRTLIRAGASALVEAGRFIYSSSALAAAAIAPGGRTAESMLSAGVVVDTIGVTPSTVIRTINGAPRTLKIITPSGTFPNNNYAQGPNVTTGGSTQGSDYFYMSGPPGTVISLAANPGAGQTNIHYTMLDGVSLALVGSGAGLNPAAVNWTIPASGSLIMVTDNGSNATPGTPSPPWTLTSTSGIAASFTQIGLPPGFMYQIAGELTVVTAIGTDTACSGSVGMTVTAQNPILSSNVAQRQSVHYQGAPSGANPLRLGVSQSVVVNPGDTTANAIFEVKASGPNPNSTYQVTGITCRVQQCSLA